MSNYQTIPIATYNEEIDLEVCLKCGAFVSDSYIGQPHYNFGTVVHDEWHESMEEDQSE